MSDKPKPAPEGEPDVQDDFDPVERTLGGRGFRGEVGGCPTGLSLGRKRKPADQPSGDKTEGPPATGSEGPRGGKKPGQGG